MTIELLLTVAILAFFCGLLGAGVGAQKDASGVGFFLGLLFGPLGVVATLGFDGRPQCPRCNGRLNGRPEICQHCRSKLRDPDVERELTVAAAPSTLDEEREHERREREYVQKMREKRRLQQDPQRRGKSG